MHCLNLVEGPGSPKSFLLEHRITTVGRNPNNDIVLDGSKVSKRHALFSIRDGDQVHVEDLDSRNGLYVDGKAVSERSLKPGMKIRVGECTFLYERNSYPTGSSSYKLAQSGAGYRLLISDGEGLLKTVEVRADCLYLGKSSDNDIVLSSADVSRRHAMLCYQDDQWELHDLESTNGTFVEGRGIEQAVLALGERFQVGSYLLALEKVDNPMSREKFEADAAEFLRQRASYLPWSVQVMLLIVLLISTVVLVGIVLMKLAS